MKKLFAVISILFITFGLFGCKSDNASVTQQQFPPQEYNKTFTLQGKIMDALTGAPIGNDPADPAAVLSVYLIQGDSDRGATKLHRDPNDPLVGEYSISGIPASYATAAGEAIFKVIVKRKGYQDFAANVKFDAANTAVNPIFMNATLNMIRNIYLFPIGVMAGDQSIYVYDPNGLPVPNAQIQIQQDVLNNGNTAITGDALTAAGGIYTSWTATTDANGLATVSGTKLVLGGQYNAIAAGTTFNGELLVDNTNSAFNVSTVNAPLVIDMTAIPNNSSLFATSASNEIPGTITSTGVLSVTFNQPVLLSSTRCFASISDGVITSETLTYTPGGLNGNNAPIDGVLSSNNTILTFTPNITTAPAATAFGATVTYFNCVDSIILKASQTAPTTNTLFTGGATDVVNIKTGNKVSGTVQLTSN